jgi:arylamine N-acetyltransferase
MTVNHERDIDGYCARIGYAGPREPTLVVLRAIVAGHTAAIPFENLDVLAKRPVRLDLLALREKLVHHQRGGFATSTICYSSMCCLRSVFAPEAWQRGCTGADRPA